jgi:hypothetical protein
LFERSRPASQLARFGEVYAEGRRRETAKEKTWVPDVWRSNEVRSTAIGTDDARRQLVRRSSFP